MKTLSIEQLTGMYYDHNIGNSDFGWLQSHLHKILDIKRPAKPNNPTLPAKHSSEIVIAYGHALSVYETAMSEYHIANQTYHDQCKTVQQYLVDLCKDLGGLHNVPEQYRSKVWSYAYAQGHSSGMNDVFRILCDVTDIFNV